MPYASVKSAAFGLIFPLLTAFVAEAQPVPLPPGQPVTQLHDPALMGEMEKAGFSLGRLLGQPLARSTADLVARSPAFAGMAGVIRDDVKTLRADMAAHGRKLYEVTDGNVGRVIDLNWLKSPVAHFELAGIANRLDRRDMARLAADTACGEARLVYRLAYAFDDARLKRHLASRLPFTLNAVFSVLPDADGSCREAARRWIPEGALDGAARQAAWLGEGAFRPDRIRLKQLEVNAQVVRFPSGMEVDFGGQAAYLLRVFEARQGAAGLALSQKLLENTPDVARLKGDAALRADLAAYIRQNIAGIDQGNYLLPDRFLTSRAISWSTFGSARLANHPFAEALPESALAGLDLAATRLVRSPAAVLERLDNGTCMGCHQANATAGFHLFGLDQASTGPLNRIKTGISPHLHAEEPRRAAYTRAVAAGREPDPFRPLSLAPPAVWSETGGHRHGPATATLACMTERTRAAFGEGWSCGAGTTCQPIIGNAALGLEFGQCLRLEEARNFSGQPCLAGAITTSPERPYQDRYRIVKQINSFGTGFSDKTYTCRPAKIGVPGGLAYRQCSPADRVFAGFTGGRVPDEICGMAGGKAFDDCVATNNFAACIGKSVVRGNRPTCGRERFCREDYMCQAFPDDVEGAATTVKDYGFCSPTYFLFQMRIDGHPDPLRRS